MGELYSKTMQDIEAKKKRVEDGGINCIPTPFKRFVNDFCGVEQDTMYCITSFTKGGKSQFVSYTFIYRTIMYNYFAKEKADFKIIYFPLEETKERIMQRFMSWLLHHFSKGQMRISPKELRSTTQALDDAVVDRLRQFDIADLLNYFEEHIIFPNEAANPTGIYKYCKQYAEEHGTVHKKTIKIKDEFGVMQEVEAFDYYEQDNPDEYRIIIIDTVNLIDTERGMNLKNSIDKLSEYCAKYLRNRYHYSPVLIQQQAFESEGNEALKLGRVRPSVAGLGDSKYVSRDADIVLGLFSPQRFGISEYFEYDIKRLKDHIRFLEVIVNRNGEMGGLLPLWFDGAVCDFRELPKSPYYYPPGKYPPSEKAALDKVYQYCDNLSNPQQKKTALFLFKDIRNIIKSKF